jgi:hypothetical protein
MKFSDETKAQLVKLAKGAAIAALAAVLTYAETHAGDVDFGQWTPIVVSVNAVVINLARKFLNGDLGVIGKNPGRDTN